MTHPLDRGIASKVKGRMIAAGRMRQLMMRNTRANGCHIYNPSDVESHELFGRIFHRLQKRQ